MDRNNRRISNTLNHETFSEILLFLELGLGYLAGWIVRRDQIKRLLTKLGCAVVMSGIHGDMRDDRPSSMQAWCTNSYCCGC